MGDILKKVCKTGHLLDIIGITARNKIILAHLTQPTCTGVQDCSLMEESAFERVPNVLDSVPLTI